MIRHIALLYVGLLVAQLTVAGGAVLAGSLFRVPIVAVRIGTLRFLRLGRFALGALPTSGAVTFASSFLNPAGVEPARTHDHQPRLVRFVLALSGSAALVLLACVLRGAEGWRSFVNGFGQVVTGALRPESRGVELVEGYLTATASAGALEAVGIVAAKLAAFNLLPLPVFVTGRAVEELLRAPGPRELRVTPHVHIGIALMLLISGAWLWAVFEALGS